MELVKDFMLQFILFSLIEGILFNYFLMKVYKLESMGIKNIILYSLGINILYFIFPPLLRQITMILFATWFIKEDKIVKRILTAIKFMIFVLIVEAGISFYLYELILKVNINFIILNKYQTFLIMIPMRFIEFYSIKIYNLWRNKNGNFMVR